MTAHKMQWRNEGQGGIVFSDYRNMRLRRKDHYSTDGSLAFQDVFIGFTGVGVRIHPRLAILTDTPFFQDYPLVDAEIYAPESDKVEAYEIQSGSQPGGWKQTKAAAFPTLKAAIDCFLDSIIIEQ